MKNLSIAVVLALLVSTLAFASGVSYNLSAGNSAPTSSTTNGLNVTGRQSVNVSVIDFRDGGAGDIDYITACTLYGYKLVNVYSTGIFGTTTVSSTQWARAPELDVTCPTDGGVAQVGYSAGFSSSVSLASTAYGTIYYATGSSVIGADAGTPVHTITIDSPN